MSRIRLSWGERLFVAVVLVCYAVVVVTLSLAGYFALIGLYMWLFVEKV